MFKTRKIFLRSIKKAFLSDFEISVKLCVFEDDFLRSYLHFTHTFNSRATKLLLLYLGGLFNL
jgi:hypothetical protein